MTEGIPRHGERGARVRPDFPPMLLPGDDEREGGVSEGRVRARGDGRPQELPGAAPPVAPRRDQSLKQQSVRHSACGQAGQRGVREAGVAGSEEYRSGGHGPARVARTGSAHRLDVAQPVRGAAADQERLGEALGRGTVAGGTADRDQRGEDLGAAPSTIRSHGELNQTCVWGNTLWTLRTIAATTGSGSW